MDWGIKIRRLDNGQQYNGFLFHYEQETNFGLDVHEHVFSFDAETPMSSNNEREALAKLLLSIIDYYHLEHQKIHRPEEKFIKISLVDGDHYFDEIITGHDNVALGDQVNFSSVTTMVDNEAIGSQMNCSALSEEDVEWQSKHKHE
ncbi:MAG: hypothetical protein WC917_00560 [Bacilli bacterium]|jgi:hypothetical protein